MPVRFLLVPPSPEDLARLLRAWRLWLFAALLGALLGAAVYLIAPPPYRARATVNVDFNLEQAWPKDTDRQQFYYLERESRKLEEIAWSDPVMLAVAEGQPDLTVESLRLHKLMLSQPAEAGWHFYADDPDPERAAALASRWAQAFVAEVESQIGSGGINEFVKLEATQVQHLPAERRAPLAPYLLAGSLAAWFVSAVLVLFFKPAVAQPQVAG